MVDALRVSLLVTTDLPPDTDLTEFGELLVDSVRTLQRGEVTYPALLRGGVFWLDRPLPPSDDDGLAVVATEELRFAALLGHLSAAHPPGSARETVADAGRAITAAVTARYGDLGSPPAVMAIRGEDVRERTPESAVRVGPGTSTVPVSAPQGQPVQETRPGSPVPHAQPALPVQPVPQEQPLSQVTTGPTARTSAASASASTEGRATQPAAHPVPSAAPREETPDARALSGRS
ncbi:hypothetical protein [Streptosporangium longisporum]|uniref:Uncharacterized protein n=1 Tax=Streptosporangium longisporum TaxID=46187 RepID=A0ABN3Y2I0_9ACTN